MNEDFQLNLYSDVSELVTAATTEAMEIISLHLLEKGECHVALTGGSLGADFARELVERLNNSGDLMGLNIWFSDERFATTDSPLRNSRPVHDGLQNSSVFVHEVASTDAGVSVSDAAARYDADLGGIEMDLCVLGLGPDGHVASLFPQYWDPQERARAIAITDSPKPPAERVSFSMNFINASSQVWIIAAGESKAIAVSQVLEGDRDIPAGHVEARKLTRLFVDREAFFAE